MKILRVLIRAHVCNEYDNPVLQLNKYYVNYCDL